MLCAKLKLHKITPNTQGIRHYDVTISGEVQSLALPRILREVEQTYKYDVTTPIIWSSESATKAGEMLWINSIIIQLRVTKNKQTKKIPSST